MDKTIEIYRVIKYWIGIIPIKRRKSNIRSLFYVLIGIMIKSKRDIYFKKALKYFREVNEGDIGNLSYELAYI
jgi:hypothetical protein